MAKVDLDLELSNADFAKAHSQLVLTVRAKPMLALWWRMRTGAAVFLVRLACWVGGMGFRIGDEP